MLGKFKGWFIGLSRASKAGVILASLFVIGVAAAPHKTPTMPPSQQPTQTQQTATPTIETKNVTETESIPFKKTTINDANLDKGKTQLRTAGVAGVKTLTYEVTYTDGTETNRKLINSKVTNAPITEVTAVGAYVYAAPVVHAATCDPNYSGACVPIASDVDCAGGSGNGPAYVAGPVGVIGTDIYGLDKDGDGIGCE